MKLLLNHGSTLEMKKQADGTTKLIIAVNLSNGKSVAEGIVTLTDVETKALKAAL